MQISPEKLLQGMQSSESEAAYDRLEALTVEELPEAVADAYRRMRYPDSTRRAKHEVFQANSPMPRQP